MKESLIKKRNISISGLHDSVPVSRVQEYLSNRTGIIKVEADKQKGILRVEYDLKEITFEEVEKSLKELGFKLSQKITERFRRGMAKFTEQNELDNLSRASSSCCADPKEKTPDCRSCGLLK